MLSHGVDSMAGSMNAHLLIAPLRLPGEVEQPLMNGIDIFGVRAHHGGDWLGALSVQIAQESQTVGSKRLSSSLVSQNVPYLGEIRFKSLLGCIVELVSHLKGKIMIGSAPQDLFLTQ